MPTKALAGDLDFNVVLVDGPAGALRAARRNLRKPTLSPGPHDPRQGFRQRPSGTTRRPLKRGRGRPPDPPKPEKPQKPQKKGECRPGRGLMAFRRIMRLDFIPDISGDTPPLVRCSERQGGLDRLPIYVGDGECNSANNEIAHRSGDPRLPSAAAFG